MPAMQAFLKCVLRLTLRSCAGALALLATAVYAFDNTMAERTLACTACHGEQGRASPEGYYPRLAGKPAGYLYNQLQNFQQGRRHYSLMQGLIAPLSDDYLRAMAQHFAGLEITYPAPPRSNASTHVLERGKTLAMYGDSQQRIPACVLCHGQSLTGVQPNVPGLLGLPRDYLNAQLGGWQTGQRRAHAPDCMALIARQLTQDDVSAVSHWLAAQPLPALTQAATVRPMRQPNDAPLPECGAAPW